MSESIAKRYFSKIVGNIGSGCLLLWVQSLMVRFLGPSAYGQFAFIQSHFEYLVNDLGFSNSFFTRISQDRRHYQKISSLFLILITFIVLAVSLYVAGVFNWGQAQRFWPEVSPSVVILGLLLALVTFLARISVLIADATGHAQAIELARLARAVFSVICIFAAGMSHRLTLAGAMGVLVVGQVLFLAFTVPFGHRKIGGGRPDFQWKKVRATFKDVWPMTAPILGYSLFTIFPILFDRWFLQTLFGSREQSYFGLALQVSTALFLSTCALTSIFHREVALTFASSDEAGLKKLFQTYTKRIFSAAALPGLFVCANAAAVGQFLGGSEMRAATNVIAIMAIYPIIQGAGQLSVAFQYATNRTKLYTQVGIVRDLIGIALSLFLVGRTVGGIPALNLGAVGLAIKFVIAVAITTYSMHFSNCRYLGESFLRHIWGEVKVILILGVTAFGTARLSVVIHDCLPSSSSMVGLIVSGLLYGGTVLLVGLGMPTIFGFAKPIPFPRFGRRSVSPFV